MFCHYAATVLTQVDTGSLVNYCDLLKVSMLLQPRRDLGRHAFCCPGASSHWSRHISCDANMCIKAS
jgi:hypothetical protein